MLINNRYRIEEKIASGGMSTVYLAFDLVTKQKVAIKIIRSDIVDDTTSVLRFEREAITASKMDNIHIVQIYDYGNYNHKPYIVMEYVKGVTLKQFISQRQYLDLDEAVLIMHQILDAVYHAHRKMIIHRDLKPQNILIKADNSIKLMDFGIAFTKEFVQLTQRDIVLGSAHYLAPEIIDNHMATIQSDIYALGIIFYELLMGKVPFDGESPLQIALKHTKEEIPSVTSINPSIPQSIENIILKATCKDVNYRYANLKEMIEDLNTYKDKTKDQKFSINKYQKRSKYLNSIAISIIIFTLITSIAFLSITLVKKEQVILPNMIAKDYNQLTNFLQSKNIKYNIEYQEKASFLYDKNQIIDTIPSAGSIITNDQEVVIKVAKSRVYMMPNFVGESIDVAKKCLKESGVNIEIVELKVYEFNVKPGTIISQQNPLPYQVIDYNLYTQVIFEVAGVQNYQMEDFIDKDLTVATTRLDQLGIKYKLISRQALFSEHHDLIIKTIPSANENYSQDEDNYVEIYYYGDHDD